MGRNKEQSARLLGHLIANAPKLVKPYQAPILKVKYIHVCQVYNISVHVCTQYTHVEYVTCILLYDLLYLHVHDCVPVCTSSIVSSCFVNFIFLSGPVDQNSNSNTM